MNKLKILFVIAALIIGGGNAAWAGTKTVYLNTGGSSLWNKDGDWFALFMYTGPSNSPTSRKWVAFSTTDNSDIFSAEFDDTYTTMVLCRMNSTSLSEGTPTIPTSPSDWNSEFWNKKDNQTDDIPAPVVNGMTYTITSFKGGYGNDGNNSSYALSGNMVYIYNLGAEEAEIDKYLCSGNWWGSNAVVGTGGFPLKLVVSGNTTYKICTSAIYYRDGNADGDANRYIHRSNEEGKTHEVYMDSEQNETNWTFEVVSDGVYKIKTGDVYLQKNSSSTYVQVLSTSSNLNEQWKIQTEKDVIDGLAGATKASSKNATTLIKNNYFAYGADGVNPNMRVRAGETLTSDGSWLGTTFSDVNGTPGQDNSVIVAEQSGKTFDNHQDLTGLPNGKYHMTTKVLYNTGSNTSVPYIYATPDNNSSKTVKCDATDTNLDNAKNTCALAAAAFSGNTTYQLALDVVVTDGVLNVGIKNGIVNNVEAAVEKCFFDDFSLEYYGPTVSQVATELPVGGAMAAGTWYYVDVDETGILAFKATTIGNIYYTTNGDLCGDEVDTKLPLNLLNSATTRYYVKSTSANNLVVSKIFDGQYTYWFLRDASHNYMSRGGYYGTQAIADKYGLPIRVAYEGDAINILFVDTWYYLFDDGSDANGRVFTDTDDVTKSKFAILPTEGGYHIINLNNVSDGSPSAKGHYLTIDNGILAFTSTAASATVWLRESVTDSYHKNQMDAVKDEQAATVATQAGISGVSTKAGLETYLSTYYDTPEDKTSSITGTKNGEGVAIIQNNFEQDATAVAAPSLALFAEETVNSLPNGLYKLRVQGFERITNNHDTYDYAGGSTGLSYLYANDQKVQLYSVFDYPANEAYSSQDVQKPDGTGFHYPDGTTAADAAFSANKYINEVFVWVTDGTIRFGIKRDHRYTRTDRSQWVCYNNFALTYYPLYSETMNEGTTYTPAAKRADVTLTRTFNSNSNNWNTFVVPFDIDNTTLKAKFGNGVKVAEATSLTATGITFTPMAEGTDNITANKPVIIKGITKSGNDQYTFDNVLIKTVLANPTGGGTTFCGNYNSNLTLNNGWYYIKDNQLKVSDGSSKMKGFRAYITTSAGARLSMIIDDEDTSVDAVVSDVVDGKIYNLQGQRVSTVQKGLFIKDGKKVVIK